MRISLGVFVFLGVLVALTATARSQASPADSSVPASATLAVPGGTPVKISVDQQLTSSEEHAGDRFQFRADDDVTVDGWIVVKRGAIGQGDVLTAEPAGGNGHPGKLQLHFDWIYGADGFKIRLSDVASNQEGDGKKGSASTATIASYLILGPLGLFAHNFVHGSDVIVKPDQQIDIFTAEAIHVVPTARVPAGDGFAR
jgi:hypothetical protein